MFVNIGEPILLAEILEQFEPDWRKKTQDDDARLPWLNPAVDVLAGRIMRNINSAAAVSPINLLAVVLLATPRQALPEQDLLRQIDLYLSLLRALPYSDRVTVTDLTSTAVLTYGESMKVVTREKQALGQHRADA